MNNADYQKLYEQSRKDIDGMVDIFLAKFQVDGLPSNLQERKDMIATIMEAGRCVELRDELKRKVHQRHGYAAVADAAHIVEAYARYLLADDGSIEESAFLASIEDLVEACCQPCVIEALASGLVAEMGERSLNTVDGIRRSMERLGLADGVFDEDPSGTSVPDDASELEG